MHGCAGFGLGFLNLLGIVLFWGMVILAIKWLRNGRSCRRSRYAGRFNMMQEGNDSAAETARERFARGDISQEEYERIKSNLGAAKRPEGNPFGFMRGGDPLDIARLRLAKGEITPEEFNTLKTLLGE